MVKLMLVISIILTTSLVGIYKAAEIKERKDILIEFKELIISIETEIGYFKEPLPNIFNKLRKITSKQSQVFLNYMLNDQRDDLKIIWEQALANAFASLPLKKEDFDVLNKPGLFLGQSDFQSQEVYFKYFYEEIDKLILASENDIKTKGQMFAKMGISIGVVIGIMIL